MAYASSHRVNSNVKSHSVINSQLTFFSSRNSVDFPNILQWGAHSNSNFYANGSNLATYNLGWSWMKRWIAARPWESRALKLE
ncbi:hypothetical protein Hanom_Chr06g00555351 [Helianthus anomalus]